MIVDSKRCGGFLTIPRGGDTASAPPVCVLARFVGLTRLGLATIFTQPRIIEGYTLFRFR